MSLEDALKMFIEENLVRDKSSGPVTPNQSLLERGVLDSLGLMNLIGFVEEQTGIRIPDDEVMLENFETITAIVTTVERTRTERGAGSI